MTCACARALFLVVLAASLLPPGRARAQQPEPGINPRERAAMLFEEARRMLQDEGRLEEGMQKCEEAYAAFPTPAALVRVGACQESAHRSSDAVETYRRAWRSASADENVRQYAARAIERLTGHAPVAEPVPTRVAPLGPPPAPARGHTVAWLTTGGAVLLLGAGAALGGWALSLQGDLARDGSMLDQMRNADRPPYGTSYSTLQSQIDAGNGTLYLLSTIAITVLATGGLAALLSTIFWSR